MTAQAKKPVNRVNKKEAVRLKAENKLTYQEIATIQGVTPAAVYRQIKDLLPTDDTKLYQDNRLDILAVMQQKLLSSISDNDIQGMTPKDRITGAAILIDKEQLLKGHTNSIANFGTIVIMPQNRGNGDWSEDAKRLLNAPGVIDVIPEAPEKANDINDELE